MVSQSVGACAGSDGASFISGAIVPVDGGCTATIAGSGIQTGYSALDYDDPLRSPTTRTTSAVDAKL